MPARGHWAPIYQSLWTHRKTFELAALLGVNETYAAAHLARLWGWSIDNAPDGDLSGLSERAIAYGAGWTQEASLFVGALHKAGFLDDDRTIHDWNDYAGKFVERREKEALDKRLSRRHAPDVPRTSNGRSGNVRRREEKSREEESREDENLPQPPPPAEGERLTPMTAKDRKLWERAQDRLRDALKPANYELLVLPLEPLGRGPVHPDGGGGGLRLRAPPGSSIAQRVGAHVKRALAAAGDERAEHVEIVET